MRFRIEQRFAAPLEAVQEAYVDPGLLERLADLPKVGRAELLDRDDNGTLVYQRVRYAFTGSLSSAVKAVVDPAKLTWVEESTLDRRTHKTTFRILPDYYVDRLQCTGTFTLDSADENRTRRLTDGDIKVRFPFVGYRVEQAIVSGLTEHAHAEVAVVESWLAGRDRG